MNWADPYCFSSWHPGKCSEPLITIDFIRDQAGRITDRTTTYGFPNDFYRDGSEFETTSYSYSPRGFLTDFETLGELLTGSFSEGRTYTRDLFLFPSFRA